MDKIWTVLRNTKLEQPIFSECTDNNNGFYKNDFIAEQVRKIEQKLHIQSSYQRYENMTAKSLKHAAEMFIYLGSCPGPLAQWFLFYTGWSDGKSDSSIFSLLADQPDLIMLTLSRIMRGPNITPNKNHLAIRHITRKLLSRMILLLTQKFVEIQSGKAHSSFQNMTTKESLDRKGKN